ncbi:hypothetical protein D910_09122 [Dendroctonus ponderosae]|uniref:SH2 domain-containing protein n=1 Tax=Dendroctonus ponderosae TaxID=77166 RepID=U4UFJ3_DENPD|nr:hypothetical protein D910_09122 [Dendroctonus ponderosae]
MCLDVEDYDDVNHTFGPLDGSIYATIAKKPELSPGAVSSPLTVSMDSGISSAGHQQNANTNASGSPPPTAQPSPLTPEDQHRELDELLSDMMLTVQSIPDFKPTNSSARTANQDFSIDNVRYIDDEDKHNPYKREFQKEEEKEIPYHARENSKPFSYGINQDMIGDSKGLSSPSLVRKASVNKSHGDTLAKVQTGVYPSAKPVPNFQADPSYNYNSTYSSVGKCGYSPIPQRKTPLQDRDPIDNLFTQSALNAQPLKKEYREEFYKDERKRYANGNLTWLQRQQQKLKERRELRLQEERQPHETRLLSELKQVQSRHMRPTASHRLDGYTSDTTAFADDDDDYTIPLHINTMQRNGVTPSSSQYSTIKSNYSTIAKNERPFMTVKRAHEKFSQTHDPVAALAANPLGQIVRPPSRTASDQVDSGLLSLVEQKSQYRQNQYLGSSEPVRYNQQSVGIANGSSAESPLRDENSRLGALDDLIANLSSGSEHSSNSPNTTAWSQFEQSSYTWRSPSTPNDADISPSHSSSPRPQTPAFPVLARTPYLNSSSPSVQFDLSHERLPPKSPTTQRRSKSAWMTYLPTKQNRELTNLFWQQYVMLILRKDRPTSPSDLNGVSDGEYKHAVAQRSVSATGYRDQNGSSSPTYYGHSRRGSIASSANDQAPHEVLAAHVKIVRDTSKFWYKPGISREEAISMLRDQPPGTFVVRDSNSFPGAFGLALRVATVPSNLQAKSGGSDELIRHFLIEPTSKGVRLKGCTNEPVFSSLSALIYQHSITQIALPCRLTLPEGDLRYDSRNSSQALHQQIQIQGAACNVHYLCTLEMESLTGPHAVKKAVTQLLQRANDQEHQANRPGIATVHFKVNGQGITLTDSKRKLFFRKHYPINTISHCGLDPEERKWLVDIEETGSAKSANRIFGFVARKPNVSNPDNQCHLFAELDPDQPATAIVNFVNKVLTSNGIKPNLV